MQQRNDEGGSCARPLDHRGSRVNPAHVPLAPLHKSPAPSAVMELLDVTPLKSVRRRGTQSAKPARRHPSAGEGAAPASAAILRQKPAAARREQRSITPLKSRNDGEV